MQSNDAIFNMRDRDCDVLIYRDSTAMTGINPDVVERNTGFKTCNISVTNSVLAVTHNLTLNQYLANNGKPRVLLIQLSPDGFQPESNAWDQTVYPEGLLELLRHGHGRYPPCPGHASPGIDCLCRICSWLQPHTRDQGRLVPPHRLRPEEDAVTIRNGFFTPPSPPSTSCEPGAHIFQSPRRRQFPDRRCR